MATYIRNVERFYCVCLPNPGCLLALHSITTTSTWSVRHHNREAHTYRPRVHPPQVETSESAVVSRKNTSCHQAKKGSPQASCREGLNSHDEENKGKNSQAVIASRRKENKHSCAGPAQKPSINASSVLADRDLVPNHNSYALKIHTFPPSHHITQLRLLVIRLPASSECTFLPCFSVQP